MTIEKSLEQIAAQLRLEQRGYDALRLYGYSSLKAATIMANAERGSADAVDLRDHALTKLEEMEAEHANR